MISNDAVSSSRNSSGEARRFLRHQLSTSRICASASGVVRTGKLTGADAVRPESPMLDKDDPPRLMSRTRTARLQGLPLVRGEVIAFIVGNQIDNRTLG